MNVITRGAGQEYQSHPHTHDPGGRTISTRSVQCLLNPLRLFARLELATFDAPSLVRGWPAPTTATPRVLICIAPTVTFGDDGDEGKRSYMPMLQYLAGPKRLSWNERWRALREMAKVSGGVGYA